MPFKKQAARSIQQSTDAKGIFIARANELLFFIHHILEPEEPTYNIISISGQGGVGKSTLMNRIMKETHAINFRDYCMTAKVDERQTTPANVMEHFAAQLRGAGQPLKKFEEALAEYKESSRRIQGEFEEEQEVIVREAVDIAGTVAEDIPIVGGLVHKGANTITELLIDKAQKYQRIKDTINLEDPIGFLTRAFARDLNQITEMQVGVGPQWVKRHRRVLLFFDTFEQLAIVAVPWMLDYFLEADINPNVVLVVAGRNSIENSTPDDPKRWLPYLDNEDIYLMALQSFTEKETSTYLEKRGITDPVKINQIWLMSRGLPLYLGLLTSNPEGNVDPTADVVENFLRWIPRHEQLKRRLALDASLFSLPFNQDDLAAFTYLEHTTSEVYQWLIDQPFVRSNPEDGRHSYHDLAQEMFSRHLNQRSPKEWYATRQMIANYYQQRIESLEAEGGKEVYKTDEWLDLTLALAQQLLSLSDEASRKMAITQILLSYEHANELEKIARVLRNFSEGNENLQVPTKGMRIIELLLQCIEADLENHDQELLPIINSLLEHMMLSFSTEALAYLYRRRGRTYRVLEQYERALTDFDKALELVIDYARAYTGRGETYRLLKDYEKAIADFTQAIELDPSDDWSYASRAQVYNSLKDYQRAIADFSKAIKLDPKYKWAYNNRGLAYYDLKDYERAILDFTHAIELDPQYTWAYANRGLTYRHLEDYERAIQDYSRAIELDPQYVWAYDNRGDVYRDLKDYEHAIQDFSRAIELDSQYVHAYNGRGLTYRDLKDYERAIQDFSRAIELDSQYAYAYYNGRGLTYRDLKDYERAIQDFSRAIELDSQYASIIYCNRGLAYRGGL